ncbi:MAG: integration host factor subunit beta [Treponema sp.]|nr:integration host factor subunit beta [Treponema sp.]
MGKITKADIVDAIYNKTGLERREIRQIVDLFIDELKAALISRNIIELRGFGTFEIKIRKGRAKARNPKTGEIVSVDSHGIASFRAGQDLKREAWSIKNPAEKPENKPNEKADERTENMERI